MFICHDCNTEFEEPIVERENYIDGFYEEFCFCPVCHSDDFGGAVTCEACDRYYDPDFSDSEIKGVCSDCRDELVKKIDAILYEHLSVAELEAYNELKSYYL